MSTMETFYILISSTGRSADAYLEALTALTTMPLHILKGLVGDLGWQQWGEQDPNKMAA